VDWIYLAMDFCEDANELFLIQLSKSASQGGLLTWN
jgi:hypothetical protein